MDIITKHFGPKASNRISLLACGINLLTCLIFFIAAAIPSNAGDFTAFDGIFGGVRRFDAVYQAVDALRAKAPLHRIRLVPNRTWCSGARRFGNPEVVLVK